MNKKKIIWKIALVFSMLICIIATAYIMLYFFSNSSSSDYIDSDSTSHPHVDGSVVIKRVENHSINWDNINKDNPDLYAWIYIPNTNVDYVVAQPNKDENDDFYLDHNTKKAYEFAGTIYSEKQNSKDFSDPVTVLYGHNMLNGSMFASLHKFEDKKFFKNNKYAYVYMPKRRLTYKIYAAYIYDDRHILNSFNFSNKRIFRKYLKYTQNPSTGIQNVRKVKLTNKNRILTLSTCTNGADNTRYLVQGVLIKDEKTK